MLNIQGSVTSFLIFVLYPAVVFASCELQFGDNSPLLVRNFGSRKVIQRNPGGMLLSLGEEVQAYCSGNLLVSWNHIWYSEEDNVHSATIKCSSKGLFIKNHVNSNYYESTMRISCSSRSLTLYESNASLPNCNRYMSYGIGIKALEDTDRATAICYDLDSFSIRYAKYLTYQPKNNVIPDERSFKESPIASLDTELKNFRSLFSLITKDEVLRSYQEKQSTNILLENQNFDFESLTQGKDHGIYENMFQIMWWHNLRIGNWNFFMNALNERAENVTYMVYTGISGVMTTQSFHSCKETEILELNINEKNTKAPAFIYSYLKSLEPNIDEEFVVIAYNTPFYTINKDIEFCKDMCDTIGWLNKSLFRKTHLMPVYGVVICCHPDEVVDKLENFPYAENKTTTSTQSPV